MTQWVGTRINATVGNRGSQGVFPSISASLVNHLCIASASGSSLIILLTYYTAPDKCFFLLPYKLPSILLGQGQNNATKQSVTTPTFSFLPPILTDQKKTGYPYNIPSRRWDCTISCRAKELVKPPEPPMTTSLPSAVAELFLLYIKTTTRPSCRWGSDRRIYLLITSSCFLFLRRRHHISYIVNYLILGPFP